MIVHPYGDHLAFSKVNLQARYDLKSEEDELDRGYTNIVRFEKEQGVVRVLEVGDPTGAQVWDHAPDVARGLGLVNHGREGINDKIEDERRGGVTLSEPTFVTEEITNFSVNRYRCLASRDQLHSAVDESRLESLPSENFSNELPVHSVVSFLEVQLKKHGRMACAFKFVKNLLQDHRAFQDVTAFEEAGLAAVDHTLGRPEPAAWCKPWSRS